MSAARFLEKLLDGAEVEWMPLSCVAVIKNGKDWKHLNDGDIPIYGSGGIMGYVDEFTYDKPTVLIPRKGSITNIFYVDKPFWNVDTIYYTELNFDLINPKYFYHFISTIDMMSLDTGSGRPSLTQAILNRLSVPIPCPDDPKKSLAMQGEIVRILNTFTELTTELTTELEARKKQYNYYRDALLTFDEDEVEWKTLGDETFFEIENRGRKPVKASLRTPGNTPYYGANNIQDYVEGYTHDGEYILIAEDGSASLEEYSIQFVNGKFWANNHVHVIRGKNAVNARFLFHYLNTANFLPYLSSKGRAKLTKGSLVQIRVPIPCPDNPEMSLAIQREIVQILDKFETLTTSLTEGLPREIELREKQYEYYRDALLNFPKAEDRAA